MQIVVKYGLDQLSREVPAGTTVGRVLSDPNVKASLGFGDNVRGLIDSVEIPGDATLPAGAVLNVETRANSKAV